jgi:KipI family sensor histidine kinase inhibitor
MPRVVPFGEAALLVEWAERPDLRINAQVHALAAALHSDPPTGLRGVTPAYVSLLVDFDPLATDVPALVRRLTDALAVTDVERVVSVRLRHVPTVYGGEFGPDLEEVARHTGLSPDEVVRQHTATELTVYMIGFAPGYPYMGDLPPELDVPRRLTPRERVPPGSVAIAGRQSSIYSRSTPGGWQLIGRTPLALFDEMRDPPAYLAPGDRVRHVPVGASEWDELVGVAADW